MLIETPDRLWIFEGNGVPVSMIDPRGMCSRKRVENHCSLETIGSVFLEDR